MILAVTNSLIDSSNVYFSIANSFNIDTATGVALDKIGEWIGFSRVVNIPITGLYSKWNATVEEGWNNSIIKGPFDPTEDSTSLPDAIYRQILKLQAGINGWDGTIPKLYSIFEVAFGVNTVRITDNQNMTVNLSVANSVPDSAFLVLDSENLKFKPCGVQIIYERF
jgi:hypothetical protein